MGAETQNETGTHKPDERIFSCLTPSSTERLLPQNPLSTETLPGFPPAGLGVFLGSECAALILLKGLAQTQSVAQNTLDLPGNVEKTQCTPSAQTQRLSSVEQAAEVPEERIERRRKDPGEHPSIKTWEGEEEMEEETSKEGGEPEKLRGQRWVRSACGGWSRGTPWGSEVNIKDSHVLGMGEG